MPPDGTHIVRAPVEDLRFSREELAGVDPAGLVARLEHRLRIDGPRAERLRGVAVPDAGRASPWKLVR